MTAARGRPDREELTMNMSIPEDLREPATTTGARWWWLRLLLGLVAIGVGIAAFAWPSATVRVVGFLFGLNLLLTGSIRAVLWLLLSGYPVLYRVLGVIFGVLTAIVGIVCLRNVTGSAILLVLIVGIGWLLDGLVELFLGLGGLGEPGRGWRVAASVAYLLAAIAVLVWPELSLATFLTVGAIILIVLGCTHVVGAVASLRTGHERTR